MKFNLYKMKQSIIEELTDYVLTNRDNYPKNIGADDLHFYMFNEDYYIIGYYEAQKWLDSHDVGVFEAIEYVRAWEQDHFGEAKHYTDAEKLVNMIVYIAGFDVLELLKDKMLRV